MQRRSEGCRKELADGKKEYEDGKKKQKIKIKDEAGKRIDDAKKELYRLKNIRNGFSQTEMDFRNTLITETMQTVSKISARYFLLFLPSSDPYQSYHHDQNGRGQENADWNNEGSAHSKNQYCFQISELCVPGNGGGVAGILIGEKDHSVCNYQVLWRNHNVKEYPSDTLWTEICTACFRGGIWSVQLVQRFFLLCMRWQRHRHHWCVHRHLKKGNESFWSGYRFCGTSEFYLNLRLEICSVIKTSVFDYFWNCRKYGADAVVGFGIRDSVSRHCTSSVHEICAIMMRRSSSMTMPRIHGKGSTYRIW